MHAQYLPNYLRPSYFNDTLILAIFVSMDLALSILAISQKLFTI